MAPALVGAFRKGARVAGVAVMALSALMLVVLGLGPHTGKYRTATVLSGSMRPTIAEGSVVVVTPLPASELSEGDVIMYRIPEEDRRVVAHRVVEVVEGGDQPVVRTQGDANPEPDAWTARLEGETLWQVQGSVPVVGHLVQALRQPWARSLSVGVVPAVLALLWLRDIWRPDEDGRPAGRRSRPHGGDRGVGPVTAVVRPRRRRALLAAVLVALITVGLALRPAMGFSAGASAARTLSTATVEPASGLSATTGCSSLVNLKAEADLSWTETPSTFAEGYALERWRGTTLESSWKVTPRATTTFTDTGLDAGTTYTWTLRAHVTSWTSPKVSVTANTPGPCLL